MAVPFLDALNLNQHELQNSVVQNLAAAPSSPVEGQQYYDSNTNVKTLKFWNGSAWVVLDTARLSNYIPLGALSNIAASTFLGNNTAGAATPVALTVAQAKSLLAIVPGDVSGFDTQVRTSRLDQMAAPTAAVSFNGQLLSSLGTPSASTDAATKGYVDSQVQSAAAGIDPKEAVRAATTANITLSGTQTVDGVALVAGDRCLVKNQTTASQNGLYTVASGAWTRTTDGSQGNLTNGALILSTAGTTNAGTQWYLQTADPITIGTTSLTFTQFGAGGTYTADAAGGLQLVGSAFSVKKPASSGLTTDSTGLYIDRTLVAYKYAATIGDGSSTSIAVTHNLGTQDVHVTLRSASAPYDIQYCTVQCTSTTQCTLIFATAPASNSLRVVVIG